MTRQTSLGKALPIKYGKARTDAAGYVAENIPVYGSSGVIGTYGRALTTGPSLIVGRKGSAGSVRFAPEPCWPIDTVYYAEPTPDTHLPYFAYLLEHLQLGQHDKSTAIPSLGRDDYNAIEVSVPNVDKQREAVAYLDEQLSRLDASVAALLRAQANLKRYRASVLQAACEGRLVPTEAELARAEGRTFETGAELLQRILAERRTVWVGSYKEPSVVEPKELPALAEGWTWATAEQLCDFITKGTTPSASKLSADGEVQFLKVYNLNDSGVLNHQHKPAFVARATHEGELARSKSLPGDVLMNIVGPPLGQVVVVPPELTEANINQAIARFRCLLPAMSGYLVQVLLTKEVLDRSIRKAKTTVGQVNLTLEICREIAIPLPPLAEQHRIVAEADRRLSLIRGAEAQVAANLARAKRLRQSILQTAFAQPGSAGQ